MRLLAKDVIISKDPFMDPQNKEEIDKRFSEQNIIIEQLRGENSNLEITLHEKEMELMKLKDLDEENNQAPKSQK